MIAAIVVTGILFVAFAYMASRGHRSGEDAQEEVLRAQVGVTKLLARTGLNEYLSDVEAFGTLEEGVHEFRLYVAEGKRQELAQSDIDLDGLTVPGFPEAAVRVVWYGNPTDSPDYEVYARGGA